MGVGLGRAVSERCWHNVATAQHSRLDQYRRRRFWNKQSGRGWCFRQRRKRHAYLWDALANDHEKWWHRRTHTGGGVPPCGRAPVYAQARAHVPPSPHAVGVQPANSHAHTRTHTRGGWASLREIPPISSTHRIPHNGYYAKRSGGATVTLVPRWRECQQSPPNP